jgi:hypothetical protein
MDETLSHQLKEKSDKLLAVDGDGKKGIVNSFYYMFVSLFLANYERRNCYNDF